MADHLPGVVESFGEVSTIDVVVLGAGVVEEVLEFFPVSV